MTNTQDTENQGIYNMPRIGDQAPDFVANTTHGAMRLSDYAKGHWTIIFSHPADFTPVCTTEMVAFAQEGDFWVAHNTKLIGVSIDSIHSHIAWVDNVRKNTGTLLDFPIVADIDMKVAKLYGMLQPGESETSTVRAVFFLDPNLKIRLIMYYPLSVGRNTEEVKRVLEALQVSDENKVSLPVNWKPGDRVIVPPPKTLDELNARNLNTEYEKTDFYLATKQIH